MDARMLATGQLVAMLLLPAGAVVAQNPIEQDSGRCAASPDHEAGGAGAAPVKLVSKGATAPWSRRTFVVWQRDSMQPVEPAAAAPSTDVPAPTQRATPAVAVPGVVQNLRRADKE